MIVVVQSFEARQWSCLVQLTRTRKQLAPLLKQAADSFSGMSCPMVVGGAENDKRPLIGNL